MPFSHGRWQPLHSASRCIVRACYSASPPAPHPTKPRRVEALPTESLHCDVHPHRLLVLPCTARLNGQAVQPATRHESAFDPAEHAALWDGLHAASDPIVRLTHQGLAPRTPPQNAPCTLAHQGWKSVHPRGFALQNPSRLLGPAELAHARVGCISVAVTSQYCIAFTSTSAAIGQRSATQQQLVATGIASTSTCRLP